MDDTPLGTVKVPDAEKNWLRVLPSSAKEVSNCVADHCGAAPEPWEVSTWPEVPVDPPTPTAPESLTSNVLLTRARFRVLLMRHPTQVIIK